MKIREQFDASDPDADVGRTEGRKVLSLLRFFLGTMVLAAVLAACGERELILEGERLDLRAPLAEDATEAGTADDIPGSAPFRAPPVVANAAWTHPGGSPSHSINHPALSSRPSLVWVADIGSGNSRGHRITASPVVEDGRVFTLDSRARVSAVSTSGQLLWTADVTPAPDRTDDASGGGLAVAGGQLFATTGFGRVVAFDAASGARHWSQNLEAVATGAPAVLGNRVYVSARDGRGWAIDATNGTVLWEVRATPSRTGVIGGPSPAAAPEAVVFAFASGEIFTVQPESGATIWAGYLLGERIGRVHARITDVTGDPVIDGGRVYAGSHSGRSMAFDFGTGRVVWSAEDGAMSQPWVSGGSVFVVSDESELVRMDAGTGARIWSVKLPFFTKERARRQKDIFAHFGPVLAGGRLVLASDDGLIRFYAPEDGTLLGAIDIAGGAASDPVVAGQTLYVVSKNGRLNAFR